VNLFGLPDRIGDPSHLIPPGVLDDESQQDDAGADDRKQPPVPSQKRPKTFPHFPTIRVNV
jgi:hypothetical protein